MSLVFNDTTNKRGIIQAIERRIFPGDENRISGNATLLAEFTADINLALDKVTALIIAAGGTWQWDDSNFTDYPIITTDLVAGQRDYSVTTDESGKLILDIYKVLAKDENTGLYRELYPVDAQSVEQPHDGYRWGAQSGVLGAYNGVNSLTDGGNEQGIPNRYDKTANGIFLDLIPSYNSTDGLKVYINREASYFTTTDTTKKPGFAGPFHDYLAVEPSFKYASIHTQSNAQAFQNEMLVMEAKIKEYYGNRERDVPGRMIPNLNSTK